MSETQHSPLEWVQSSDEPAFIVGLEDETIAHVYGDTEEQRQANAALIVTAVNHHQELVSALEGLTGYGCECVDKEPKGHCPFCIGRALLAKIDLAKQAAAM